MFSRLFQRVALRPLSLNVSSVARTAVQPLSGAMPPMVHTRSLMATAYLAMPAAKSTVKKPAAKKTATTTKKAAATKKTTASKTTATKRKTAAKKTTTAKKAKGVKPKKRVSRIAAKAKAVKKPKKKAAKPKPKPTLLKMKIPKDQEPPKGPGTAYIIFVTEYFNTHKAEGLANARNRVSEAAKAWQQLSDEDRQKYEDLRREKVQLHNIALTKYMETVDPKIYRALTLQRRAKGKPSFRIPEAVKSAIDSPPIRNPYARFVGEYAKTIETPADLSGLAIGRYRFEEAAKKWKTMSDSEKQIYKDATEAEIREYEAKKEAAV
ncbi:uncharacterized protein LAESUDRAFT_812650 [Laetiporus sulphureus 93-53]|uniref:HMG box domain-containing protein n=1 Tax=Laetiporus sulphureus 93-53 TaxID=1314785 RepID=A0A165EBT8_9APHY|nr:uncharacterized protein LAESUDRAFT_812650 [Laetiporus sulphureus 93-53]KZT06686.1 hypothetical protein LAESUDRAFT_812650 [Laetiporus sulphureus 93-53]